MRVTLLQDWDGKPALTEIELEDAKAKRLIATGLVAKTPKPKVAKRKASKRQSVSFSPGGI